MAIPDHLRGVGLMREEQGLGWGSALLAVSPELCSCLQTRLLQLELSQG